MMDDTGHFKDLNAMPVSVKARGFLESAGLPPLDRCFHCVQMALGAIDLGLVEVETDVAETVKAMMDWRPQRLSNFFILMTGEEYEPAGWESAGDLQELAVIILDDIENKMLMHFPYYRNPES